MATKHLITTYRPALATLIAAAIGSVPIAALIVQVTK